MTGEGLNLNFIKQEVENLEAVIGSHSIDYAIDIESSFFYPNRKLFLDQLKKVLKKDGVFLYATIVPQFKLKSLETQLKQYFEIQKEEDISENAIKALQLGTPGFRSFIENNYPYCK